MKRLSWKVRIGTSVPVVLGALLALPLGCGAFGTDGFLELERCDILNCNGLFFSPLDDEGADDHDDMAGMEGMDDADAHDDEDDEHLDGADDHDGDADQMNGVDDHHDDMGDMSDHDDGEEEEHDDASEGDDGSGSGVARRL